MKTLGGLRISTPPRSWVGLEFGGWGPGLNYSRFCVQESPGKIPPIKNPMKNPRKVPGKSLPLKCCPRKIRGKFLGEKNWENEKAQSLIFWIFRVIKLDRCLESSTCGLFHIKSRGRKCPHRTSEKDRLDITQTRIAMTYQ